MPVASGVTRPPAPAAAAGTVALLATVADGSLVVLPAAEPLQVPAVWNATIGVVPTATAAALVASWHILMRATVAASMCTRRPPDAAAAAAAAAIMDAMIAVLRVNGTQRMGHRCERVNVAPPSYPHPSVCTPPSVTHSTCARSRVPYLLAAAAASTGVRVCVAARWRAAGRELHWAHSRSLKKRFAHQQQCRRAHKRRATGCITTPWVLWWLSATT